MIKIKILLLFSCVSVFGQTIEVGSDIKFLETKKSRQLEIIQKLEKKGFKRIIKKSNGDYSELVGQDESGRPLYYLTGNTGSGTILKIAGLHNKNITGSGLYIGMWDAGKPRVSHELLGSSRIIYGNSENPEILRHSTHIAGTLIGTNGSLTNRGIAYNSRIFGYDWLNDTAEMELISSKTGTDVIANNATSKILVANNSYGYDPIYMQEYQFGKYNQMAKEWDGAMCKAPYFQIVKSAGNTRLISDIIPYVTENGGYDLLEGAGISKNVLVIGAINENKTISNFSNFGPTDDGRIKPDFVAKGSGVVSSIEITNSAYASYNGTSSASASVSAGILLLQQYARTKFDNYLKSSTIRALLVHTSEDILAKGPDYQSGWGIPDFTKAVALLDNLKINSMIKESTTEILKDKETHRISIAAKGGEPLIVTLAWTDPEGDLDSVENQIKRDVTTSKLKNDLDIRIERLNPNGTITNFYPWKLQGVTNKTGLATNNSTNDVDNIEKIELPNIPATGGIYTLVVSHKRTLTNSCTVVGQPYSLVLSGISYCTQDIVLQQNQDNINISNTVVKARKITASNKITSLQITPARNVQFYASDSVELVPQGTDGFTVETGTEFLAEIESCGLEMQKKEDSQQIITNFSEQEKENPEKPIFPKLERESKGLKIYPNPANNFVNIEFNLEYNSTLNYQIYDLIGNLVVREEGFVVYNAGKNIKKVDLSSVPSGIYILSIKTSEHEKTYKIIKN